MTLQQIVDMQEDLYPAASNWTDTKKVGILNAEIRETFRDMKTRAVASIQTVADTYIYNLPAGVSKEHILWVGYTTDTAIDDDSRFSEHKYALINTGLSGRKWYDALDDQIGIYPIPDTTSENIVIIYDKVPAALIQTTMTGVPEITATWHRILVYALIIEIAGSGNKPDTKIVNMYTSKYNDLKMLIIRDRYDREQSYPVTRDVMRKKRSRVPHSEVFVLSDLVAVYGISTVSEVLARNV